MGALAIGIASYPSLCAFGSAESSGGFSFRAGLWEMLHHRAPLCSQQSWASWVKGFLVFVRGSRSMHCRALSPWKSGPDPFAER
jgi:hypothetical protein